MIEIKAVPGKLIMLGKQGENLAREVIFDVSGVRAEFGDGAFRLSAKRPGEADAYPATVTETGDTVVWALTGADTQNAGRGQCELAYYAGETRLKTWTYDTAIAKSLTGSPKTDPYDEFLDEVNRLAAEAYSKNVPSGCRFAQVEKIGGKTVARDTGELVSAGVEDVEVQGANLIPYPANSMKFPITINGITVTANDDGTYLVNGTATNDIYVSVCNLNAAGMRISNIGDVVLSGCPTGGNTATYYLGMYFGQWRADAGAGATATIGTIPDTARIEITIRKGYTANNLIFSPQLRRGTTITGYSPYFLDTYPIPDAVKALPGYGWSAGNLCNEIGRRADGWDYVQRVGLPATTDGYTALGTPTTTDITDLMAGALPLMTTEPGGTITMHHALADNGLTLDVPNTIKYIRDLKEVVSSGTE